MDAGATLVNPRQAFLCLLCHRRTARSAPCAEGLYRSIQWQVRSELGRTPRSDICQAKTNGRYPAECGANEAAQGNSFVGFPNTRSEKTRSSPNGNVRRFCRA